MKLFNSMKPFRLIPILLLTSCTQLTMQFSDNSSESLTEDTIEPPKPEEQQLIRVQPGYTMGLGRTFYAQSIAAYNHPTSTNVKTYIEDEIIKTPLDWGGPCHPLHDAPKCVERPLEMIQKQHTSQTTAPMGRMIRLWAKIVYDDQALGYLFSESQQLPVPTQWQTPNAEVIRKYVKYFYQKDIDAPTLQILEQLVQATESGTGGSPKLAHQILIHTLTAHEGFLDALMRNPTP